MCVCVCVCAHVRLFSLLCLPQVLISLIILSAYFFDVPCLYLCVREGGDGKGGLLLYLLYCSVCACMCVCVCMYLSKSASAPHHLFQEVELANLCNC